MARIVEIGLALLACIIFSAAAASAAPRTQLVCTDTPKGFFCERVTLWTGLKSAAEVNVRRPGDCGTVCNRVIRVPNGDVEAED